MDISFIGLGSMGTPMARNLIKAGHSLTVYNRTRHRAEVLQAEGAKVASEPGEAARAGDVLVTMLADDKAVEAVLFEPGKALEGMRGGAVHISMSTISVELSRRLAEAHHHKRQHFVSATVLGRPDVAAAAKLFVIAAGAPEQIKRCQPVFDALGQRTFIAGDDPPAANVIKLSTNFLLTAVIEGLAEAFALVRKHGLDQRAFLEFLTGTLFSAPAYRNYGAMVAANNFEPVGFKLLLGLKDNRLLLAAAEQAGVPMPMASLIHDRFVAALAQGLGEADWAGIARISYQEAGLQEAA